MNIETFEIIITVVGVTISMSLLASGLISFFQYQQAGKNTKSSQENS